MGEEVKEGKPAETPEPERGAPLQGTGGEGQTPEGGEKDEKAE